MLTQFITAIIFVAIIGCVLYGRRLIKTEKVDAVFGNPERAKGGTHWVIVGTSAILLVWLYYSWDIAKGFYPKSANELCQVAKVNESLLGLKYQFPIEEREFKSTSIIKIENKNLQRVTKEIQNSPDLNKQQKNILLRYIDQTKKLIPLLTNDDLMEMNTKLQIKELTEQIIRLSSNLQKKDYPFETSEQKAERQKAVSEQGNWGIITVRTGTGSIENTIEVPMVPETNKGLKFDVAAKELKIINDKFFKLRNHNLQFKNSIKQLKDEIKAYRKNLDDTDEVASTLAKDIVKIARRIEYASIYPPAALNEMKNAIIEFDNVQKNQQGGLWLVDLILFPAGTIVSSGTSCSEQGSGRWLPKPSDTFNKFVLMSKPSVGYKNIPLLWIEMIDVSSIVGFILPDWLADILPGEYPVHTNDGVVKQNFKGQVLKVVTGIRVAVGMCWGTLVAAEFLAGTTGIGFVENVAKKYFQYEVIWITIFIMGMLGLLFDITLRKIIDKTIPWRGKG